MQIKYINKIFLLAIFIIVQFSYKIYAYSSGLVVIVNKSNPVSNLSIDELRSIYRFEYKYWKNGTKINISFDEPESSESKVFNQNVYKMDNISIKKYIFTKIFKGEIMSPPKVFNSGSETIKYISENQGAIGYVKNSDIIDSRNIKILEIDGL